MKRKTELSVMNVLFCAFVIFIHVSSAPIQELTRPSWQFLAVFTPWKLASFAVYGFFFLGGIRFALHPPEKGFFGTLKYYRKRLFRIVIPYVIWVAAYVLWSTVFADEKITLSLYLDKLIHGTAASHFYYVLTAIQFYALAPLWRRLKKESAAVVLPLSLAITVFFSNCLPEIVQRFGFKGELMNDRIFTSYLFFWLAGVYAGLLYDKFCAFLRRRAGWITLFFLVFAFFEVYCNYLGQAQQKWFSMDFATGLHLLYICGAILFFATAALYLKKLRFFGTPFFRLLDRCTFSIYLSHLIVMGTVDYYLAHYLPVRSILIPYAIRFAATYVITLGVCSFVCFCVRKIRKKSV